ncbi:MAG: hypothetical protein ACK4L7_09470 [Flavobacteriales bacterium]
MRLTLAFALALLGHAAPAQRDSSLTREFARLSAKERTRIAAAEQEAAARDERFQTVMAQAEGHFREQRFEEALALYREARAMRPYNVYPKVRIQDLEALLAQRAALPAEPGPDTEEPPNVAHGAVDERPDSPPEAAPRAVPKDGPDRPARAARPPEPPARPASGAKQTARPMVREPQMPDGMVERSFVEGRAVVLERRVVKDGAETVYRKVAHPWGQVVHFRDGLAISEREWEAAFGPQ